MVRWCYKSLNATIIYQPIPLSWWGGWPFHSFKLSYFQSFTLSNFHSFKFSLFQIFTFSHFHSFRLLLFQTFMFSHFYSSMLSLFQTFTFHTFTLKTFTISDFHSFTLSQFQTFTLSLFILWRCGDVLKALIYQPITLLFQTFTFSCCITFRYAVINPRWCWARWPGCEKV